MLHGMSQHLHGIHLHTQVHAALHTYICHACKAEVHGTELQSGTHDDMEIEPCGLALPLRPGLPARNVVHSERT
jgi:hypothetical protein